MDPRKSGVSMVIMYSFLYFALIDLEMQIRKQYDQTFQLIFH